MWGRLLDEIADAIPYTGADRDDAQALIDALADRGWRIMPVESPETAA